MRSASEMAASGLSPAEVAAGIGRLWWSADDGAEAAADKAKWEAAGALIVALNPEIDAPRVRMILVLEKAKAPAILGYEPESEEWLIEAGLVYWRCPWCSAHNSELPETVMAECSECGEAYNMPAAPAGGV